MGKTVKLRCILFYDVSFLLFCNTIYSFDKISKKNKKNIKKQKIKP